MQHVILCFKVMMSEHIKFTIANQTLYENANKACLIQFNIMTLRTRNGIGHGKRSDQEYCGEDEREGNQISFGKQILSRQE